MSTDSGSGDIVSRVVPIKLGVLAPLALVGSIVLAGELRAEDFTSAEFLKWEKNRQIGYLTVSATMAGVIASQIDRNQSRCIDAWYVREERAEHKNILSAMRQHPNVHPQGMILWVIQNECGKIGVSQE